MNLSGLDISIIGPAFIAGLVVLSTHVLLGHEVLRRGIIFIDLAIAQIAGLGIVVAYAFGWDENGTVARLFAVAFALLGAWLLNAIERHAGRHQEAIIGIAFILASAAGILLMAHNPHGGDHLQEILVGQILWVTHAQLLLAGGITAGILLCWFALNARAHSFVFYTLFAVAITASVQLVGVYLVFASLILPAIATDRLRRMRYAAAMAIGTAGYAAGLLLSALFDLPSGAVIVWTLAVSAIAFTSARVLRSMPYAKQ